MNDKELTALGKEIHQNSEIDEIDDGVYVGTVRSALPTQLKKCGITRVVNCFDGLNRYKRHQSIEVLNFSISNALENSGGSNANSESVLRAFKPFIEFVSRSRLEGHQVLIHCYSGSHRAGAAILAWILYKNQTSLSETLTYVQSKRSGIELVGNFERLLIAFEEGVRNVESTTA